MRADAAVRIRAAEPGDVDRLLALIRELAEYERLDDAMRGDANLLATALFEEKTAEALIAEVEGEAVGYAIFFSTFSTFECRPGLWIEDLFVEPERRRQGIGRGLLSSIAGLAVERGCARLEWSALDWNEPALRFYAELGARRLDEWQALRLEGNDLRRLGAQAHSTPSAR
jgi:GNAT superfamily N-acetyltransferase